MGLWRQQSDSGCPDINSGSWLFRELNAKFSKLTTSKSVPFRNLPIVHWILVGRATNNQAQLATPGRGQPLAFLSNPSFQTSSLQQPPFTVIFVGIPPLLLFVDSSCASSSASLSLLLNHRYPRQSVMLRPMDLDSFLATYGVLAIVGLFFASYLYMK